MIFQERPDWRRSDFRTKESAKSGRAFFAMSSDSGRCITRVLLLVSFFSLAQASDVLIVDSRIEIPCTDYSVEKRACVGGHNSAYPSTAGAIRDAHVGDKILMRGGTYGPIEVSVSGSDGHAVEISAFAGERVVITATESVAIRVIGQHDILIRNLIVRDVSGFGRIEDSHRIVIDGLEFRNARSPGTTGALKFVRSSHNRLSNSTFEGGSDLLILQDDSNRNFIDRNTFGSARHSLISIRCSNQNIVRENEFANSWQKAMEIYDCQGISDAPVRLNSTARNIVEHNWFRLTASADRNHKFNAIQHGGQRTIVRHNVFSGNLGGGVNYQFYPDESLFVHGNRLYNNTFLDNRCGAIVAQRGARGRMYDNVAANNLLYGNVDCVGSSRQIDVEVRRSLRMRDNLLAKLDPGLVPTNDGRQCPAAGSPVVDAGVFVARTTSSGSGTIVPVDDSSWFSDGYGVVDGDMIQFYGDRRRVRIVDVDYELQTIEIADEWSWEKEQGVHLAYEGAAPDQGAFEFGSRQCDESLNLRNSD
jgi:hypothetical protein